MNAARVSRGYCRTYESGPRAVDPDLKGADSKAAMVQLEADGKVKTFGPKPAGIRYYKA